LNPMRVHSFDALGSNMRNIKESIKSNSYFIKKSEGRRMQPTSTDKI
jgi:hypothetical protein